MCNQQSALRSAVSKINYANRYALRRAHNKNLYVKHSAERYAVTINQMRKALGAPQGP